MPGDTEGLVKRVNVARAGSAAIYPSLVIADANVDYPSVNASYWVSSSTDAPPCAVNMGLLGPGMLYQTIAGTPDYATPETLNLTRGAIPFGHASTGIPVIDQSNLFFDQTHKRLLVGLNAVVSDAAGASLEVRGNSSQTSAVFSGQSGVNPIILEHGTTNVANVYAYLNSALHLGAHNTPGQVRIATTGAVTVTQLAGTGTAFATLDSTGLFVRGAATSTMAPYDARYWVSTTNASLPNRVDLGLLSSGLLYHSVTTAVSTPAALPLSPGAIVFGHATNSGPDTDVNYLSWDKTNRRLLVGQGGPPSGAGSALYVKYNTSGHLAVFQYANTTLNIQSANVGIQFHNESASGHSGIMFSFNTGTVVAAVRAANDSSLNYHALAGARHQFYGSADESTHYAGIGGTGIQIGMGAGQVAAAGRLQIASSVSSVAIALTEAAAQRITKTGGTFVLATGDANQMEFWTTNSSRMAITAAGAVYVASIAGSGTAFVTVDASGQLIRGAATSTMPSADAYYFLRSTTNAPGANYQSLGALANGLLKHSVTGAVSTIAVAVAGTDFAQPATALTGPAMVFTNASGQLAVDANNAVWDDANDRLILRLGGAYTPAAGAPLTISGATSNVAVSLNLAATQRIDKSGGTFVLSTSDSNALEIWTNGSGRANWSAAGLLTQAGSMTISALTAGSNAPLEIQVAHGTSADAIYLSLAGGQRITKTGGTLAVGTSSAHATQIMTNGSARIDVASGGGVTVSNLASGVSALVMADTAGLLSKGTAGTHYVVPAAPLTGPAVLFTNASGNATVDTSNFVYDDANNRLILAKGGAYSAGAGAPLSIGGSATNVAILFEQASTAQRIMKSSGSIAIGTLDGNATEIWTNNSSRASWASGGALTHAASINITSFSSGTNAPLEIQVSHGTTADAIYLSQAAGQRITKTGGELAVGTNSTSPLTLFVNNSARIQMTTTETRLYQKLQFQAAYTPTVTGDAGMNANGRLMQYHDGAARNVASTDDVGPYQFGMNESANSSQSSTRYLMAADLCVGNGYEFILTRGFNYVEVGYQIGANSHNASASFILTKNGTDVGTIISIGAGSTTNGTVTFSSAGLYAAGDGLGVRLSTTGDGLLQASFAVTGRPTAP